MMGVLGLSIFEEMNWQRLGQTRSPTSQWPISDLACPDRPARGKNSSIPVVGAGSRFGAADEIDSGCMCTSAKGRSGGDSLAAHGNRGSDSDNWPAVGPPNMFDPDIPPADGPPTDGMPP